MSTWGSARGGTYAGLTWNNNTEGRGQEYNAPNVSRFGGEYTADVGTNAGSRCSAWNVDAALSPVYGVERMASRFVCDHLAFE